MSKELLRITEKLYNTPHLISQASFNSILEYLEARNSGVELAVTGSPYQGERYLQYNDDTQVGIISIEGPLTYLAHRALCQGESTSYQKIKEEFDELVEVGAKTIVLDVDSSGGEAYSMTETGRYLREKADEHGIRLVSYVDGGAYSAGYGLAASAHELILNPESQAGSIGVVVRLRNTNKAMKKMGVEDTFLFAGKSKIPFDADGEWREDFLEDIQETIDSIYTKFVGYVAEMRGIDEASVRDTQAKVFDADRAIALGLADKTMTREMFSEYLATLVETRDKSNMKFKQSGNQMKFEELELAHANLESQLAASTVALEAANAALEAAVVNSSALEAEVEKYKAEALALNEQAAANAVVEAQAKATARKERLVASLGAEKGETLAVSLESLSDEAFALVAESYEAQANALAAADVMTQELGVGAEGEGEVVDGVQAALKQLKIIK